MGQRCRLPDWLRNLRHHLAVLGGLAPQLDNSLEIGDCIKVCDLSGRVPEIQ